MDLRSVSPFRSILHFNFFSDVRKFSSDVQKKLWTSKANFWKSNTNFLDVQKKDWTSKTFLDSSVCFSLSIRSSLQAWFTRVSWWWNLWWLNLGNSFWPVLGGEGRSVCGSIQGIFTAWLLRLIESLTAAWNLQILTFQCMPATAAALAQLLKTGLDFSWIWLFHCSSLR